MLKLKRKNKIYSKYEDMFNPTDLKDPDKAQRINLTIEDFDAKGHVANPRAPCVVTTIDPDYTKNSALQRKTQKFRMKTDILRLREITRKKFVIYATQQKYLEKQREEAFQDEAYQRITEFQEFALNALCKIESSAFAGMQQMQKQLQDLQRMNINEELRNIVADHQRILMEVQEVYARFLFLLKVISYFDEIISPEDIENGQEKRKLTLPKNVVELEINEKHPVGQREVSDIIAYMDNVIRPYLAKRSHLNSDIWIKGYERTRHKIFNFNRRFAQVALLNHLVFVIHDKSEKVYTRRVVRPILLAGTGFLKTRIDSLKQHSFIIFNEFEKLQKKDKLLMKLNAIVSVILHRIEDKISKCNDFPGALITAKSKNSPPEKSKKSSSVVVSTTERDIYALERIEKMHWYLQYSPDKCRQIEINVRKRLEMQKDFSRRALIQKNRLHNWMDHYKKHDILRQSK
ncbi:uncharacterized protein LOC101892529 isoform X3 [Musca domestica]|uniref:Uncharacterized protein LOC101892529 isoform X3 n=1 Tax=Musca domestica TaxID=7370 RepID=A0ABM3VAH6_MUSDO|nr:uncharacterized protein LOC101892529 isoform X3 [Musca domestica]